MRMRKFLRIRLEQTGGTVNPWVSLRKLNISFARRE